MTQFAPGPDTKTAFRDALGTFTTGVTVVTCRSEAGPLGITANSFTSVSLDPALVLWCPAKSSSRFQSFVHADRFAIHVLRTDQQELGRHFATDGLSFDGIDWTEDANGVPLINQCLARFDCHRFAIHDGGDHAIIVGQVTLVTKSDGAPLIFNRGQFGGFSIQ